MNSRGWIVPTSQENIAFFKNEFNPCHSYSSVMPAIGKGVRISICLPSAGTSACGVDSVTLWEVDKTGLKKMDTKEGLFVLKSLAAPEVKNIEKSCFVLSSIGMRNLFTTNVQGIFFLYRNDYSFVVCTPVPLPLLMKDMHEHVEMPFFRFHLILLVSFSEHPLIEL